MFRRVVCSLKGKPTFCRNNFNRLKLTAAHFSSVPNAVAQQDESQLIVRSVLPDVDIIKGISMQEYAFENLGKWESLPAFECGLSGRVYTHGEIYKLSKNFGAALMQSGLKRNEVLSIVLPNMPEFPVVLYGSWFAGLVAATVNPTYTPGEIAKQLSDSNTKCIVTLPIFMPLIQAAIQSNPSKLSSIKIIVIGEAEEEGTHSFFEMVKTDSKGVSLVIKADSGFNPDQDTGALMYSSGTTGLPKGCMLTHSNLVNDVHQFKPALPNNPLITGDYQEKVMGLLPFFHIMGFQAFNFICVREGCHVVCLPKFDPDLFVHLIKEYQFTTLHLVTPLIAFVIQHPELGKEEFQRCMNIFSGACPSGEAMVSRLLNKIGHSLNFQEGYGMTELSPVSHSVLSDAKNTKIGSIGVPLPSTLSKVIDLETGKAVGPNQKGEICVKGPQVMKGYLNNEQATKDTIDNDGWLHTGDIGYYTEDKHFYVVDRLKELIKVKGMQVAPSELESVLREHPKISDVAVIGIPHPEAGELPRAYVVKKDESLKETEVDAFVKDRLAKHKHLVGGVEFIDVVPKAPSGKILRRTLKEAYLQQNKN